MGNQELHDLADLIQVSAAARILELSAQTVVKYADTGKLPCMRTPGTGWRLFHRADVEKLAAKRAARKADLAAEKHEAAERVVQQEARWAAEQASYRAAYYRYGFIGLEGRGVNDN